MIKFGVADYGLQVWYGNMYDYEERIDTVKKLGFDGLERLYTSSAEETLHRGAYLRKNGMSFATVHAENIEQSIKWTAAMGGKYVWLNVMANNVVNSVVPGYTFDDYIRQINEMTKVCKKYGIDAVLHNHMGTKSETQAQTEEVLARCPDLKLLFDVGHMAVAGGDVKYMVENYFDRIAAYHFKGWQISETTPDHPDWDKRGYFCGLGQGNFNVDNEYVFKYAVRNGFDGWMFIEHDTHKRDPEIDLAESLGIMKSWYSQVK